MFSKMAPSEILFKNVCLYATVAEIIGAEHFVTAAEAAMVAAGHAWKQWAKRVAFLLMRIEEIVRENN
jgi:hypothetical protein